tara:strand:- start:7442 stop:7702 length:261 start_codon:yes stop_codon:yes gene_type:complete
VATLPTERVALMAKHITELRPDYTKSMDIRGTPTTVCLCGCNIWNLKTLFDPDTGEIEMYFLDMECADCGTLATAPTPIDDGENYD